MALTGRSREAVDAGKPVGPTVLELRVHGVNNTPPAGMLEVGADDIEQSRGDSLGSFWQLTDSALAHGRAVPPTHHDHVPADVRREAYSWGAMSRNSPSLPGGFARAAVSAASRAGWLLLLPLGLANVAYWSRAIPGTGKNGRGARSVRVFSLGLSLLTVTAMISVSLDLVGTQCIRDDGGTEVACSALPTWLAWLTAFTWTERLVVLSLVPVAALLVLRWLASASRVRYEHSAAQPVDAAGADRAAVRRGGRSGRAHLSSWARRHEPVRAVDPPVLARPGLWSRWVLARSMANLHVATGLALVVGTLSWTRVYVGDVDCHSARTWFEDPYCRPGLDGAFADAPLFAGLLAASLAVALAATFRVAAARADDMPQAASLGDAGGVPRGTVPAARSRGATRGSRLILAAAVALFLANAGALWFTEPPKTQADNLLGLESVPGLLVALMLGIALAGLGWRRAALSVGWIALAVLALGALAADVLPSVPGGESSWLGIDTRLVALVALIVLGLVSVRPFGQQRSSRLPWREQAWAGAGPGVFLLVSLGSAMMLTGLLVVALGDWLNGAAAVRCLAAGPDGGPSPGCTVAAEATVVIPTTYAEFAVATVAAVGVVLVLAAASLGIGAVLAFWRGPARGIPPAPAGAPAAVLEEAVAQDADVLHPAGRLADLARRPDIVTRVAGDRFLAALSHRVELMVGFLAAGFAVALSLTLFASVDGTGPGWQLPGELIRFGLWMTALLWTGLLLRVVTSSEGGAGRPFGILWDLIGFLPRSAHPFGPPCYAERAVPELAARLDAWLRGDDLPRRPEAWTRAERKEVGRRRVVVSAHSLGAVLAVAALFSGDTAGPGASPGRRGRVALVSYGSQLRPYFGRIFPELLGSDVLGTAPCRGTAAFSVDPWRREVEDPPVPAVPAVAEPDPDTPWYAEPPDTLVRRLSGEPGRAPAWVNLWRRTDPLGFPAASYGPNLVDRGAEEIDPTAFVAQVATHSGYPRTAVYRRGVGEVLRRLDRRP